MQQAAMRLIGGRRIGMWAVGGMMLLPAAPALAQTAEQTGKTPNATGALFAVAIVLLLLLAKTAVVAGALAAAVYCPRAAGRARRQLAGAPFKCFCLGVLDAVVAAVLLVIMIALSKRVGALSLVLYLLLAGLIVVTLIGLSGLYARAGRRLRTGGVAGGMDESEEAGDMNTIAGPAQVSGDILRGGALIELATMIPIAGWLGAGVILFMALGAGVLGLFQRRRRVELAAPGETVRERDVAEKESL